jgi:TIR domain
LSRIFLSHSSRDNHQAVALTRWLSEQRPELANEIFLDISAETGLRPGQRWKDALREANDRCEAVICLLSRNWESSPNCKTEYLTAENLGKQILVARLENLGDTDITSEWQRCDLFAEGAQTEIAVSGGAPVRFNTAALDRLKKAIEGTGIGPENFVWPPTGDRQRAPYRGWEPFEDIDAGVFFGRDAAVVRGTDELRAMRTSGLKSLFVVLGPSGSGKSSFLRAGLIPRLQRDDRHFRVLGIVRPERNALTGEHGLPRPSTPPAKPCISEARRWERSKPLA